MHILRIITILALAFAIFPRSAAADALTRSNCWTWTENAGGRRTLCFAAAGRVKMSNRSGTVDNKGWTTCEWSGQYAQTGAKVTVAFAPGSGKCSNGADSPQYSLTCNFPGDRLDCRSSSLVEGKLLEFDRTFQ